LPRSESPPALLRTSGEGPTLSEYLEQGGYSNAFREDHIVPMASALSFLITRSRSNMRIGPAP